MRFLLDTNAFREVGKDQRHPNVGAWLGTVDDVDLAVSAITVREIYKGIGKLQRSKPEIAETIKVRVDAALDVLGGRLLPVTRQISELWGEMLAKSDKHVDDTGIAATARVHGLVLVTRNQHDVAGRGVDTIDPYRRPFKIVRAPDDR